MITDARPEQNSRMGRALLVFAGLMGIGAVSLGALALWPTSSSANEAALDVTTLTAVAAPETIAPRVTVPVATPPPIEPADVPLPSEQTDGSSTATSTATTTATTTVPAPAPIAKPLGVTIGDIDLWGPVTPVGLEANGELEVPNETEVGWYELGSSPGLAGSTVLAAHVTWNNTFGPFYNLGTLEPGALVDVHLDDETTRTYEVVERTMYDKDALPRDRIWRRSGDETLVLITCGGSFNRDINRYRQNIVVYAVPVA